MELTRNKDINMYILNMLSDKDLISTCLVNKYFSNLCNEEFFKRRSILKFPKLVKTKPSDIKWKNFYLSLVIKYEEMKKEYGILMNVIGPKFRRLKENDVLVFPNELRLSKYYPLEAFDIEFLGRYRDYLNEQQIIRLKNNLSDYIYKKSDRDYSNEIFNTIDNEQELDSEEVDSEYIDSFEIDSDYEYN